MNTRKMFDSRMLKELEESRQFDRLARECCSNRGGADDRAGG